MKKAMIYAGFALALASCSTEVTEEKELNEALNELSESLGNELDNVQSTSTESESGAYTWKKFAEEYDKNYDMIDGNKIGMVKK